MSRIAKTLTILLLVLFAACSSLSNPGESDARQVLEQRSGGLYKVSSLRKTDGQSFENSGVKGYRFEYAADVECLKANWNSPYPPLRDDFAGGPQCTSVGQVHHMNGTITFQQTENGWRAAQ